MSVNETGPWLRPNGILVRKVRDAFLAYIPGNEDWYWRGATLPTDAAPLVPQVGDPDANKPRDLRFAASIVRDYCETRRVNYCDADDLHREADQLERERESEEQQQVEAQLVAHLAGLLEQATKQLGTTLGVKLDVGSWEGTARAVIAQFDITPKAGA
jgi:hypothetical protein